jgi:hypothetical protein
LALEGLIAASEEVADESAQMEEVADAVVLNTCERLAWRPQDAGSLLVRDRQ